MGGQTVHTLDYPPLFAYFEYVLCSNDAVNSRCFALLGGDDNTPSDARVIFRRMTVVLSDILLYIGAWFSRSVVTGGGNQSERRVLATALLIVANPGLLLLYLHAICMEGNIGNARYRQCQK